MDNTHLPVAIIGAGPVGLAAAAHLLARGLKPLILEAGPKAGSSIEEWAHVKMHYHVTRIVNDCFWSFSTCRNRLKTTQSRRSPMTFNGIKRWSKRVHCCVHG